MTILWLVALPLVVALLVILFQRLPLVSVPLAAGTLVAVAILAATLGDTGSLIILGRSIGLSSREGFSLAIISGLLAVMMLYTYAVPQGQLSHSLSLAAVAFFAASMIVRNMTIATLFLQMGGIVSVMLIPSQSERSAITATRALIAIGLSGMLLLLSAWAMESRTTTFDTVVLSYIGGITLIIGFGIALAVGPFYVWLPPVFRYSSSLAAVVVSVALSSTLLVHLGNILTATLWPGGHEFLSVMLVAAGVATVLIGGLSTLFQRTISRILAYATLADLGIILIGLGLNTRDSLGASYLHMAYRGMAVVLVAMADGMLKALPGGDDVDSLRGALRRAPLATAALLVGGLSLAGLPPFAGFGTRFSIYRVLATEHPAWVLVVLACSIGPAWSFIRCFVETLRPERSPAEGRRENLFPALLTLPLTLGLGLLGLAPQLLTLLPVPWFDLVTRGPLLLGH